MEDNAAEAINHFWSETRRLDAEAADLLAKERKRAAEELHRHPHKRAQWVPIVMAMGLERAWTCSLAAALQGHEDCSSLEATAAGAGRDRFTPIMLNVHPRGRFGP